MKFYRINPGQQVRLDDIDPDSTPGYEDSKDDAKDDLDDLTDKLEDLQERFHAAHNRSMLVVLQGTDTSGKDGTIRHVFDGVNPQGVRLAGFKAPTEEELDHDFLWRVHQKTPAKGEIALFNRSHYEDVLIVRVHQLVPEEVWRKRYTLINNFEYSLAQQGTIILKFFLHISKKEQTERLLDRLNEPDKHWKFNPDDLKDRDLWDEYQKAYQDMLNETSTEWAPWYVIPADHKWYRNLVVASVLVNTLKEIDPRPSTELKNIDEYREQLEKD